MLFFTEMFHRTDQSILPATLRQARPSCRLPDITLPDIMTFTALALQMGHTLKDSLHDHWSGIRQLHNPFYGETMTWDRFLHILHLLHFADNSQRPDKGEEYDRLWKLRTVFDKINEGYAKFYNPLEHLAVDEVTKIQGQGYLQAVHSKEKKFRHQNLQYLWWIRVYIWHESVLGQRFTLRHWWHDFNTYNC